MILANHGIIQSIQRIVTDGLVLYLDAGNPLSYPGTGTTWTDVTGNGNNGTLVNGPTFDSSNGGSIVFDGTDDFVSTNYNVTANSSFTITVWVKRGGKIGFSNRVWGNADTNVGNNGIDIIIPDDTWIYNVRRANGSVYDISVTGLSLGTTWHEITVSYDHTAGVGSKLYLDNTFLAANTSLGHTVPHPLNIASDGDPTVFFGGNIGAFYVYNRGLSASEIQDNFNALKSRYGL